jgi:hypothetical protein
MFFVFLSEEALDLEFTEKTLHNLEIPADTGKYVCISPGYSDAEIWR